MKGPVADACLRGGIGGGQPAACREEYKRRMARRVILLFIQSRRAYLASMAWQAVMAIIL